MIRTLQTHTARLLPVLHRSQRMTKVTSFDGLCWKRVHGQNTSFQLEVPMVYGE
jgi:hypothetical protein